MNKCKSCNSVLKLNFGAEPAHYLSPNGYRSCVGGASGYTIFGANTPYTSTCTALQSICPMEGRNNTCRLLPSWLETPNCRSRKKISCYTPLPGVRRRSQSTRDITGDHQESPVRKDDPFLNSEGTNVGHDLSTSFWCYT